MIKNLKFYIAIVLLMFFKGMETQITVDSKCLEPLDPGPCRMSLERYYYNTKTNACETFKFGGCRGNNNKFGFRQTCEQACIKQLAKTATAIVKTTTARTNTAVKTQTSTTPRITTTGSTTSSMANTKKAN